MVNVIKLNMKKASIYYLVCRHFGLYNISNTPMILCYFKMSSNSVFVFAPLREKVNTIHLGNLKRGAKFTVN